MVSFCGTYWFSSRYFIYIPIPSFYCFSFSFLFVCGFYYLLKFLVWFSPSKKIYFYLICWKPFKNDEKYFFFHLKTSFHSLGISIRVLIFWLFKRNDLIRVLRLILKFLTSQLGYQTMKIHILPNISQKKATRHYNLI